MPNSNTFKRLTSSHFFAISGRTDLRKGVSEAKFDPEADFDVKKSLGAPKSAENHEKPKKKSRKIFEKKIVFFDFFFSIRNRLKRVLAKFGGSNIAKKLRKTEKTSRKIRENSRNSFQKSEFFFKLSRRFWI